MIPIATDGTPNIRDNDEDARSVCVIDENGNIHKPTYPRRAKGLVKKGRARYVNEDTICLSGAFCDTESNNTRGDNIMSDINNEVKTNNSADNNAVLEMILTCIDKIIEDNAHISRALSLLENTEDACKFEAIQSIVEARENTNQRMLDMLDKMYDNSKPMISVATPRTLEMILEVCHGGPFSDGTAMLLDKVSALIERMGMTVPDEIKVSDKTE